MTGGRDAGIRVRVRLGAAVFRGLRGLRELTVIAAIRVAV
jgi:hypothetical protein